MSLALTAIYSQTFNSILEKLFEQNTIDHVTCSSYEDLILKAKQTEGSELVFISRELIRSVEGSVEETLAQLRAILNGSIYILSSYNDPQDIEKFIHAGATDVILTSKIEQVEHILKSFRIHLDTIPNEKPFSILLVDVSKSLSATVKHHLESMGMNVYHAPSVEGGLDILKSQSIDAIICDIVLEGDATGLELVRQTYQNSRWKGIPLMITTSFADYERQKHFYRLGVRDVMQKPYDLEILSLKITSMAKEHRIHELLIQERKKIEELAFVDAETGLNNRAFLRAKYDDWLKGHPTNTYAFLIEIDDYQKIKREYGINQCEVALKHVADALTTNAPAEAIATHLNGEQFVLLTGSIELDQVETIAKKLIKDIAAHWVMDHKHLSICIGIAEAHNEMSLNDLLKIADGCLYLAKEEGHGHYETT
jgi:two-component system cell cycle response regulator